MKGVIKIALGILLAFTLLIVGCGVLIGGAATTVDDTDTETTDATTQESESEPAPEPARKSKPKPDKPEMTAGQENALESARSYLETGHFSKKGLMGQLTSEYGEGYSKADAKFALNNVDANYKQEAVEAAKSYLDTSSFSEQGLLDQLTSEHGEQFTSEQARYAVDKVYK